MLKNIFQVLEKFYSFWRSIEKIKNKKSEFHKRKTAK